MFGPRPSGIFIGSSVWLLGLLVYAIWDNWWVNWDGGFYLYLARSLREGHGYVFPDGTWATFRPPGYPGLFALVWTVLDISAKTAMWTSRAVLLVGGAIVAWVTARLRGGLVVPMLVGLMAVIPPLVLESGAWYFVPDGAAAVLVLASIAILLMSRRPDTARTGLWAGLVFGLSFLLKETALVYAPIPLAVVWVRSDVERLRVAGAYLIGLMVMVLPWTIWALGTESPQRFLLLPTWLTLAGIGAVIVASFVLLRLRRQPREVNRVGRFGVVAFPMVFLVTACSLFLLTKTPISNGVSRARDELAVFLGWSWLPALLLLLLAIAVGRRIDRGLAPMWLAGLLLVGAGLGQAFYAGAAQVSMRNAVAGVFGLALTSGAILGKGRRQAAGGRQLSYLLAVAFLGLAAMATASIDSIGRRGGTLDNPVVHDLNQWLAREDSAEVATTPTFATYTWFLDGDLPRPELLEIHYTSTRPGDFSLSDFCKVHWWAASIERCPDNSSTLIWSDATLRLTSAMFVEALVGRPEVVVVTGRHTLGGSPIDGAGLLYVLEREGLGRRLFATSEAYLPYWAAVYEVDQEELANFTGPSVLWTGLSGMDDLAADKVVTLDGESYLELLTEVLPP